jgi:hypothetical protein
MTLLRSTRKLLQSAIKRGVKLREIAPEGGSVDHEWLKKFRAGKIADPSVNRIQALHDRLTQMKAGAA